MIPEFQFSRGKWQVRIVTPAGALAGAFKFDAEAPNLDIRRLLPGGPGVGAAGVTDLPRDWGIMFIRLPDDALL